MKEAEARIVDEGKSEEGGEFNINYILEVLKDFRTSGGDASDISKEYSLRKEIEERN